MADLLIRPSARVREQESKLHWMIMSGYSQSTNVFLMVMNIATPRVREEGNGLRGSDARRDGADELTTTYALRGSIPFDRLNDCLTKRSDPWDAGRRLVKSWMLLGCVRVTVGQMIIRAQWSHS